MQDSTSAGPSSAGVVALIDDDSANDGGGGDEDNNGLDRAETPPAPAPRPTSLWRPGDNTRSCCRPSSVPAPVPAGTAPSAAVPAADPIVSTFIGSVNTAATPAVDAEVAPASALALDPVPVPGAGAGGEDAPALLLAALNADVISDWRVLR